MSIDKNLSVKIIDELLINFNKLNTINRISSFHEFYSFRYKDKEFVISKTSLMICVVSQFLLKLKFEKNSEKLFSNIYPYENDFQSDELTDSKFKKIFNKVVEIKELGSDFFS